MVEKQAKKSSSHSKQKRKQGQSTGEGMNSHDYDNDNSPSGMRESNSQQCGTLQEIYEDRGYFKTEELGATNQGSHPRRADSRQAAHDLRSHRLSLQVAETGDSREQHSEYHKTRHQGDRLQGRGAEGSQQEDRKRDNAHGHQEPQHQQGTKAPGGKSESNSQSPQDGLSAQNSQSYFNPLAWLPSTKHPEPPFNPIADLNGDRTPYKAIDLHAHQEEEIRKLKNALEETRLQLDDREIRLTTLKDDLERVQKQALAWADRFQPTVDTEITNLYRNLDAKVTGVCKSLHGVELADEQIRKWPQEARWEQFVDKPVEFSSKTSRREVLIGVVWKFLYQNIFARRFGCFGGELAETVDKVHAHLFECADGVFDESDESVQWRSITAKHLMRSHLGSVPSIQQENLRRDIVDMFESVLGYTDQDMAKFKTLAEDMLENAAGFKRILMQQRAIFKMFVPNPRSGRIKIEKDDRLRNNEEEDGTAEGKIWFVVKPGLMKFGTGRGNDLDLETVIVPSFVKLHLDE